MGGLRSETTLALVRTVMAPGWKMAEAEPPAAGDLADAIAELEHPLSLKHLEPGLDGQIARLIEDALRPIGAALDPRLSSEQAKVWRKAVLLKLSDLPGPIALKAVRKAVHEPFQFFSEVDTAIRKIAADALAHQRLALFQLRRWQREIERAANPLPALEPPPPEPVTQEEVDQLNATMRRSGCSTRWRLEDGEAVMAEPPSDKRRGATE